MTKEPTSGALRVLWGYLRGMRVLLGCLLVLELVGSATALAQPLVTRWVLEQLQVGGSLVWPLVVLTVLAVVGLVLAGTGTYMLGRNAMRLVARIRSDLVAKVLGTTVGAVERRPVGEILSRVGSDTTLLEQTVGGALVRAGSAPLAVLAALALMGMIDLPMLAIVVVLLALTTLGEKVAVRMVGEATREGQEHLGAMTSALHRVLLAFRTVKASGTEGAERLRIDAEIEATYQAKRKAVRAEAFLDVIATASVDVTFLAVLAVGATRVAMGNLGVGDLVAFLLYVIYLREPLETLSFALADLAEGLAAVQRVEDLRDLPVESTTPAQQTPARHPAPPDGADPEVRFDHVWFGYGERPVLRDVSFAAPRGLTVLVGPSGTGKTTLLSLAERFVDVQKGRVLLDGIDVREWDRAELRGKLAYVQQEAPLLGDTIREAVLYGVPDTESVDLDAALRAVALDAWVESLPQGLDTPVGERGVSISGGQRQRLAVARALLRGADVLLLDEATSQLDAVSERTLLESVTKYARSRVVVAVTHRMAVAAEADQVVLLDAEGVRAVGKHDALLRSDARYRLLAAMPRG
jgi:ABC-type multidrug transport system fused ATPase/permease subunit